LQWLATLLCFDFVHLKEHRMAAAEGRGRRWQLTALFVLTATLALMFHDGEKPHGASRDAAVLAGDVADEIRDALRDVTRCTGSWTTARPSERFEPPVRFSKPAHGRSPATLAVIYLGEWGDRRADAAAVRTRAERWSRLFTASVFVGGDERKSHLMSCNAASFPNLVTCAAQIMSSLGAIHRSVTILDATLEPRYDKIVAAFVKHIGLSEKVNASHPFVRDVVVDVEEKSTAVSDMCRLLRFVQLASYHIPALSTGSVWPSGVSWGKQRQLRLLHVPSSLFLKFTELADAFVSADVSVADGIGLFVTMLVLAVRGGDGVTTPHGLVRPLASPTEQPHAADTAVFRGRALLTPSAVSSANLPADSHFGGNIIALNAHDERRFVDKFPSKPIGAWTYAYHRSAKRPPGRRYEPLNGVTAPKRADGYRADKPKRATPDDQAPPFHPTWHDGHAAPRRWNETNHYPPAIVMFISNEVLESMVSGSNEAYRRYLEEVMRRFRRCVFITSRPVPWLNGLHAPFPRQCVGGGSAASIAACLSFVMKLRIVRRSGGAVILSDASFIVPRAIFGGDALDNMLVSKRHQHSAPYAGGAADSWAFWRQPGQAQHGLGEMPENGMTTWNRAAQHHATYFREYRQRNEGVAQAAERRWAQFADIFFIPSRAFDLAIAVLQLHLPFMTPGEGFIGFLATVLEAATPVFYNTFDYQGCAMCGADAEIMTHDAGHRITPLNETSVGLVARRFSESFECSEQAVLVFGSLARGDNAVARRVLTTWPTRFYHAEHRSTCRVNVTAQSHRHEDGDIFAQLLAPMANDIALRLPAEWAAANVRLFVHAPNANTLVVTAPSPVARVTLYVATGVTTPTRVSTNISSGGGPASSTGTDFTLDEGQDVVAIHSPGIRKLTVTVETGLGRSTLAAHATGPKTDELRVDKV
jgi:hypothetical protein